MKRISIGELTEGMILDQDVFASDGSIVPIVKKNAVLTGHMIQMLQKHGVQSVDVVSDVDEHKFFIPEQKPFIAQELRNEAISNLEDIFSLARHSQDEVISAPHLVKQLDTVVEQLVSTLIDDENALVNIADLKSYDEYTYHHSLSVAVLAIAIGQSLGFSQHQLHEMGKGAMMHDIGKTAIPIEIINKPSKLNNAEFALVKNHSPQGYQYLINNHIGEESLWKAVLFHHEKIDGTGYPLGLKGNDIPLMSRVLSVSDVYDALTSNRPYRKPMEPAEAVEYIMGNVGTAFDFDIVMAFVRKIELYPVGSFVELSNHRIAVVLANENAMRPVVRLVDTGEIMDLYWDRKYLNITIERIVPDYNL